MDDKVLGNTDKQKINLTLLNGSGYIFNVDDYLYIRRNHRIVGSLVGTPSNHVLGSDDSTLPVELSIYETKLLIEEGLARLVSKSKSLLNAEKRCENIQHKKDENADQQLSIGKTLPETNLFEIYTAHPTKHFAKEVLPPEVDEFKYRVFHDIWSRGKYITGGESFGADFLLYPGDPMQYHASHIVILLRDTQIHPLDVITKTRTATVVNKHCVFAYLESEQIQDTELRYQTILWEGNPDNNGDTLSDSEISDSDKSSEEEGDNKD